MSRPIVRAALSSILAASIATSTVTPAFAQRAVGQRPDIATDEGGLWAQSDKAETEAKTKAELNRDPELTPYVRGVACKVAAEYCGEVRVYVLDRPYFNAAMAPNGYMEVWSGLLLRARSESELAFVLGHEVTHFAQGHSLASWRKTKSAANAGMVFMLVGGSIVGGLLYLGVLSSLFAFDRTQETEADALGLARAVKAGYDPSAAAAIWRSLGEETAASDFPKTRRSDTRASIFNTHPITPDRIAALDALAAGAATPSVGERARYRAQIRRFLPAWLTDDLRRRDYGQTLHLIDRLAADGEDLGVLEFYKGEAFRRRRQEGDLEKAKVAYAAAATRPDAPVAVWRELGDVEARLGLTTEARTAYETYLAKAGDADDRWLVEASLKKINGGAAS
ncbi:MAG TPA: M48 family metallopeptidase [Caulobacter sp.]|nr:M48 family metallopeptidase [Caulobacter sp.]